MNYLSMFKKNNYMVISNRTRSDNLNMMFRGQNIERVCSHKFLGVIIDETLKFDVHIYELCVRISQSIGIMRRVSDMVPLSVLRKLYYALLFSWLTYEVYTWGSAYLTALRRLKSMVKKQ